jgi:hypothetical protein
MVLQSCRSRMQPSRTLAPHLAGLGLLLSLGLSPSSSDAREPLSPGVRRTTSVNTDVYHQPSVIVRQRTGMRAYATFSAEPQLLTSGSAAVFEARSVSDRGGVPRWRCVARHDVAECLGSPLRLRYLPEDVAITLKVEIVTQAEAEGARLTARP